MDLALKDVRRHAGKFVATIVGVGLLLSIVLVMNGIYQGNIEDGVWLIDNTATDLWVVERGRGGPFNEASRIPLDSYKSVAATRELDVHVAFDNVPPRFAIDQEAEVSIAVGEDRGILVPLTALTRSR